MKPLNLDERYRIESDERSFVLLRRRKKKTGGGLSDAVESVGYFSHPADACRAWVRHHVLDSDKSLFEAIAEAQARLTEVLAPLDSALPWRPEASASVERLRAATTDLVAGQEAPGRQGAST